MRRTAGSATVRPSSSDGYDDRGSGFLVCGRLRRPTLLRPAHGIYRLVHLRTAQRFRQCRGRPVRRHDPRGRGGRRRRGHGLVRDGPLPHRWQPRRGFRGGWPGHHPFFPRRHRSERVRVRDALQSDGKIPLAGSTHSPSDGFVFALARYNPDGSLDPSFSGDGLVTTAFPGAEHSWGTSVAVQSDGKILVAGRVYSAGDNDFAVWCYNADGSPDTTFNGNGLFTIDLGENSPPREQVLDSLAVLPDGRIVLGNIAGPGGPART